jgi:hypothetical protein
MPDFESGAFDHSATSPQRCGFARGAIIASNVTSRPKRHEGSQARPRPAWDPSDVRRSGHILSTEGAFHGRLLCINLAKGYKYLQRLDLQVDMIRFVCLGTGFFHSNLRRQLVGGKRIWLSTLNGFTLVV